MHLPEDFQVTVLEPGEPVVLGLKGLLEFGGHLRPTELLILPKGAKDDTPSFMWKLRGEGGKVYYAQITRSMLVEGLARAGAKVELKHIQG